MNQRRRFLYKNKPKTVHVGYLGNKDAAPIIQALIDDPRVGTIELTANSRIRKFSILDKSNK